MVQVLFADHLPFGRASLQGFGHDPLRQGVIVTAQTRLHIEGSRQIVQPLAHLRDILGRERQAGHRFHETGRILGRYADKGHIQEKNTHGRAVRHRRPQVLIPFGQLSLPFNSEPVHFIGDGNAEDLLKGIAPVMVRAGIGGRIVQSVGLCAPDIIGGQFQALDMHGVFLAALADLFRSHPGAVRENVPDPFTKGHQFENLHHRLIIAEMEFQTARIIGAQDALLIQLHGKADGHPGRHAVQPQFIGQSVRSNDGIDVVHTGLPPKGVIGLVLRAFSQYAGIGSRLGHVELAASHRASITTLSPCITGHLNFHTDLLGHGILARG